IFRNIATGIAQHTTTHATLLLPHAAAVHVASAATGSVEISQYANWVKALQRGTERLPQLSAQRVFLLALPRPGVSAQRQHRVSPAKEGAERREFWALRRQVQPTDMRRGPGYREILHLAAQEKIALPLLLTVGRHHIHEGAGDPLPECWGDLPVRQGIAKRDHIVHIDTLTDRIRHGKAGVAIRELAMLHDLSQTHQYQRTGAERRQ